MKKLLKNIEVYVLALSMCATMFSLPVIADTTDPSTEEPISEHRRIYVDFMGKGANPQDSFSDKEANFTVEDLNSKFWIAVSVDKSNDLPLLKNGVYSLEVAFEYNPKLVEPYSATANPDKDWADELAKGNLAETNNDFYWNSNQYEIISVRSTEMDTTNDRERKDSMEGRKEAGWEMCTVCVTFKDGLDFENARFMDLNSAEKQCLIKIPFKLVGVPDEGDPNQLQPAISLVMGPETLDIGSGEEGINPYSSWKATITDPDDETNMKTLFEFGDDISLFGKKEAITNIIPVKPKVGEETEDTQYVLSRSKELGEEKFDPSVNTYYLGVPNGTDKLKLIIQSSEAPKSVTVNGEKVTTSQTGSAYETAVFDLAEINRDTSNGGEADGFNNTITVVSGSKTYTIYVRRLLKPKIVLNYGNSPYGEIMKSDIADKDEAKEKFYSVHPLYGTWLEGYTPESMSDNIGSRYAIRAWTEIANTDSLSDEEKTILADDKYNMDRNEYAIFVYNGSYFREPGYTAVNSYGETVDLQRYIEVNRMLDTQVAGLMDEKQWKDEISIGTEDEPKPSDYLYTEITKPYNALEITTSEDRKTKGRIRPDIYYMKYWFNDPVMGEISETRPVIVLQNRGDNLMLDLISNACADPAFMYLKGREAYDGLTGTARQIYFYRQINMLGTSLITNADVDGIYTYTKIYLPAIQNGETVSNPLLNIYKELPSE